MHASPFRILLLVAGMPLVLIGCRRAETPPPGDDFVTCMNLGKAFIENRESTKAIEKLARAVSLQPKSAAALRNLARAYLIGKEAAQAAPAFEALTRSFAVEPDSTAGHYLTGLALTRLERYADAVAHFESAVRQDPDTATLRYQLGRALEQSGQTVRAHEQFNETVRLDPLHATAVYRLAAHARERRDMDEVRRLMLDFQRLIDQFGRLPEQALEQCAHSLPELPLATLSPSPAISVTFVDATAVWIGDMQPPPTADVAAVIDVDDAGRPTLFVAGADGAYLMHMSDSGTLTRTAVEGVAGSMTGFTCCIAGDFFIKVTTRNKSAAKHDALADIFLIGPSGCCLLERVDGVNFRDRTADAGLADVTGHRAAWIDYDHDGDLDLFIAGDAGVRVWQNSGQFDDLAAEAPPDGKPTPPLFTDVTESIGIAPGTPASDVASVELDNNVAIDAVVARGGDPTTVYVNQRAGRFAAQAEPPGPWPSAHRVAVDDLNNDGWHDAVLTTPDHVLVVLGHGAGQHRFESPGDAALGAALLDYDNDGRLDILTFGGAVAIRLWRNGVHDWTDVTPSTGFTEMNGGGIRDIIPADYDADGDDDLALITDDGRLRFLRNDGGHVNGRLKIHLVSILTNPSGIGTRVELRGGPFWVTRNVTKPFLDVGLAGRERLDAVLTVWTNGVTDNETSVVPGPKPLTIIEKIVEAGSCPFLLAWNGDGYRFVTDILGNAPLGLSLTRDVLLPADPDEFAYVGNASNVIPRDGACELQVTEAYREVLYLDTVQLFAVDHPADTEIHPSDKIRPPPFPPSHLWQLRNLQAPVRVLGSDGIDRTAAVQQIDGVFAPPPDPLPPPYRGMGQPLSLILDFTTSPSPSEPRPSGSGPHSDPRPSASGLRDQLDSPLNGRATLDVTRPLVLALTGWLRYGNASVNIAMSQNQSLSIIPPTLEVETGDDRWQPVDCVVGMPAGKTKTIIVDLRGKLPAGARKLRLTTTFEIRWDRIALADGEPLDQQQLLPLPLASADLAWRGYPHMAARAPDHPITPDYSVITDLPPWRTQPQGWCTRYGDIRELLTHRDDQMAIINAGDAVTLRFAPDQLPPPVPGRTRSFFFYSVGWNKDADYNVVAGDRVPPFPASEPELTGTARVTDPRDAAFEHDPLESDAVIDPNDWRLRYNTRWVSRDAWSSRQAGFPER